MLSCLFFICRIHGSVDCLSELSSHLSNSFSGESSAGCHLFEIRVCIYYAAFLYTRISVVFDSCNCHAGTIRRSFSTSSAISTRNETSRSRPATRCASLSHTALTFYPLQPFQLHPNPPSSVAESILIRKQWR